MKPAALVLGAIALGIPSTTAYSNAGQLSLVAVISYAHEAGFSCADELLTAVAIAVAESSLYPTIRNPHPEYGRRFNGSVHADRGLWQISSYWWPEYSDRRADDPASAARIAYSISDRGRDFSAWDTYDNGAAQHHFDQAFDGWPALRPVVTAFCDGR
jgi:hypothetical protein